MINKKTTEEVTTVDYTSENSNSDHLENESAGHPNESDIGQYYNETVQATQILKTMMVIKL